MRKYNVTAMVRTRANPLFQDVKMAPIQIRMGGYGPPTTGFSKALKFIGDKLAA